MDMVTLITIIAIGAMIAAIALFLRQRGNSTDEDYDDAEDHDDYEEDDEDVLDEDTLDDENDEGDEDDDEDTAEDDEYYDDDEYEVEEFPLESYKATVVGMDIERRQSGSSKNPSSSLTFLVEFKIRQGRSNSEVITLSVPEEIYSDIRLGENALLVVQGNRFIDFGDRYAEDADEEDIKTAEKEKKKNSK